MKDNNNIEVIKSEDNKMDERFWMDSNLAQFDDILRANYDKSLEAFSDEIISYLATVTQAMRGAFFVLNDERTHLEATGGYACTKESMPKSTFKVGEDLIGQAVKSKKVNYLKDLPLLNLTVDAAAGKMSAGSLIILPLHFNDEAYGVLELVYLHNLEDKYLDLLQRMVKNVATTLNSIQNNERTKKLLKDAQDQAEMLRTQEEELRQNLEELNATQHNLEVAQNRLQVEAEKSRVLFESSHEAICILNVANATFTDCNEAAVKIYGAASKDEVIGKTPLDFSPEFQADGQPSQEKAMGFIGTALETGSNTFEWLHLTANGVEWMAEIKLMAFELDGEKNLQVIIRDITQQKQQQKELEALHQKVREEGERSRVLFESSHEAMVILNISDATFTDCNEAAVKIYGFNSKEEVIGKTPLDVSAEIQPDGHRSEEKANEYVGLALEKGVITFEWLHTRVDGTNWMAEVKLMTFELNGVKNIQFILRDITEKKQQQQELEILHQKVQEEVSRNRVIFESSMEAMCFMTPEVITDCNQAALDVLGFEKKEDLVGKPPSLVSSEYQIDGTPSDKKVAEYVALVLEQGQHSFEWISRRANGETFFSEVKVMTVELSGEQLLHFTFRDISKKKQNEEALAKLHNRFRLLNQVIQEGLWEISISKNSADWENYPSWFSEHFIELLGYNPEEWVPELRTWLDIIHPKDKIKLLEQLQQNIANPGEKLSTELRINTPAQSEEYHHFKVSSLARTHPDNQFIQLLGTLVAV